MNGTRKNTMFPHAELGASCTWRLTKITRSWPANSPRLKLVTPLPLPTCSTRLTALLRPSLVMAPTTETHSIQSGVGQAKRCADCGAAAQDGRALQYR